MNSPTDSSRTTLCDEEKFKDFSDIDSEDSHSWTQQPTRSRLLRAFIILISVLALLTPVIYFLVPREKALVYDQCGQTADEARARNCVFEVTGFTWIPKACHDPNTEQEFLEYLAAHDLGIYRYANYSETVPIEEVKLGNGPGFFVFQQYHVAHCLHLIKKLHRAYTSGQTLDGQIMPTHHTEHCVDMALKGDDFRKGQFQFSYTKYPYCGKPGGWAVGWVNGKPSGWTDS